MSREVHVQFCERVGVKLPCATQLVILCRPREGKAMKERLGRWLEAKGLALNENKTQVVASSESSFNFLGYNFSWRKSKKGTSYVHTEPGVESRQRLRDRLRAMTKRVTTWRSTGEVVREMNQANARERHEERRVMALAF